MNFIKKQRIQLLIYHAITLYILTRLYTLGFSDEQEVPYRWFWGIMILILIVEQYFYNGIKNFINKIKDEQKSKWMIIAFVLYLAVLLILWQIIKIVDIEYNILVIIVLVILTILYIAIDLIFFGIKFGNRTITLFERFFIWVLLILIAISIFSVFDVSLASLIQRFGNQATMLSFAFAFILYYIAEFSDRKERYNKNLVQLELEESKKEIVRLNQQLEDLKETIAINKEISKLKKEFKDLELKLTKHMDTKAAQIIKKTRTK